MSTNGEEADQKKRSQKIDKDLEEDSKRLRRECKILLLGTSLTVRPAATLYLPSPVKPPSPGQAMRSELGIC